MSRWGINIPLRSREQALDAEALCDLPRAIADREDRAVTRELLLEARTAGMESIGDLLDDLENATPAARRATLDEMRERAGLEATGDITAREAFDERQRTLRKGRDAGGKVAQGCHAEGCERRTANSDGSLRPVAAAKWFCAEHEALAEAGDLEPPAPRFTIGGGFELIPGPAEQTRLRAEEAKQEAEERTRREQRQAEAEVRSETRRRRLASANPLDVAGVSVPARTSEQ